MGSDRDRNESWVSVSRCLLFFTAILNGFVLSCLPPLKLVAVLLLPMISPSLFAQITYKFDRLWPTLQQPWYFTDPKDIEIDRFGSTYVVDSLNSEIHVLKSSGPSPTSTPVAGHIAQSARKRIEKTRSIVSTAQRDLNREYGLVESISMIALSHYKQR